MPNGQFPLILAGAGYTAALLQSMLPPVAYKAIDTSRATSTTLTADPDLQAAVAANARYMFLLFADYEGGTQGSSDFRIGWSVPSGTTMRYGRTGIDTTGAVNIGTISTEANTPSWGTNGAGNPRSLLLFGSVFAGSAAGTLAFEWCQGTSSATATILHAQSAMWLVRMA